MRRLAVAQAKTLPIRLLPLPIDLGAFTLALQWHQSRDSDSGNPVTLCLFVIRNGLSPAITKIPCLLIKRFRRTASGYAVFELKA